jgi:hypothetical protein
MVIGLPGESLADIVLNKTNRIKRCSVAAYRINRLLALLFPMMLFVSANTARSRGLSAWIALWASYLASAQNRAKRLGQLTRPLNASKGFILSSYLSLYRPISSSRRSAPLSIPAPLDPLGPGMAVSRYDWVYRTFSYSLRLSDCSDLISARRSEIESNCLRSSFWSEWPLPRKVTTHFFQFGIALPEAVSLRSDNWQDGSIAICPNSG